MTHTHRFRKYTMAGELSAAQYEYNTRCNLLNLLQALVPKPDMYMRVSMKMSPEGFAR